MSSYFFLAEILLLAFIGILFHFFLPNLTHFRDAAASEAVQVKLVAGVSVIIYLGYVGGWFMSPLYQLKEKRGACRTPVVGRWPRPYMGLQIALLVFTLARLHPAFTSAGIQDPQEQSRVVLIDATNDDGDKDTDKGSFELSWGRVVEGIPLLQLDMYDAIAFAPVLYAMLYASVKLDQQNNNVLVNSPSLITKSSPIWAVVLRNMVLYMMVLFIICAIDITLAHIGKDSAPCAFMWSGVPVKEQVADLIEKWLKFHPQDSLLVRISHAFTYLPILMCLTRRSYQDFVWWAIFHFFIGDAIGNFAHVVDSPEIAELRMGYQDTDLCSIDRLFIRELVSFPLNWLFLTTTYGDNIIGPE